MVDVVSKMCLQEGCPVRSNDNYDGFCCFCFAHLFPTDPRTANIRTKSKELKVRDYINQHFENFTHDKPVFSPNCDCSHRRRIDHYSIIGNTILAIETDEFQHKRYDKQDELDRYDDLVVANTYKWVFIRFNPDKYKDSEGNTQDLSLEDRLPSLKTEIEKQIMRIKDEKNGELVEIIWIYYDEV